MARIRTIKPEFFLHEDIAKLAPLVRLAFIGLWLHADRQGRLEDRAVRLRVQILPYDDANFDEVLCNLATAGFITRYEVDGHRYIAIPTFSKHQLPQSKERASRLPPPPGSPTSPVPTESAHVQHGADTGSIQSHDFSDLEPAPSLYGLDPLGTENGERGKGNETTTSERNSEPAAATSSSRRPRGPGRPPVEAHPEAAGLCELLADCARRWKPDVKVNASSKSSVDGMDGLLRLDGRDPDKVRQLVEWLFLGSYQPNGEFDWRVNVLSGASLRKQWDRIANLHDLATSAPTIDDWTGR